jgi:hypothetical protein
METETSDRNEWQAIKPGIERKFHDKRGEKMQ